MRGRDDPPIADDAPAADARGAPERGRDESHERRLLDGGGGPPHDSVPLSVLPVRAPRDCPHEARPHSAEPGSLSG